MLWVEILIVLGLSLGQSAVYALLTLWERLLTPVPLAEQTATLNTSDSSLPWLDLVYQVVGLGFALMPVVLALYLLATRWPPSETPPVPQLRSGAYLIGLTPTRLKRDLGWGILLAGGIGLPGIVLYLVGRALGITVQVQTNALGSHWWIWLVLILAALKNGLLEEVVVVGYLAERLRALGWRPAVWMGVSALLRAAYHAYQGWGAVLGNAAMGLVFAWYYHRARRVAPLVVAHTLMDVVAFVGPELWQPTWLK
jgi:membrane protease YdiL (CAAX protease family)